MRVKIVIQYDGTDFCGWQRQPENRCVQTVLEDAIFRLTGERCDVIASGRTDSGVHALAQVAHFDTKTPVPPDKIAPALNVLLPSDVRVVKSSLAEKNFNARYSAKKKTYRYAFYVSRIMLPMRERYAERIYPVDVSLMKKASELIEGTHDFSAFLAADSSIKSTVRTVYSCKVTVCGKMVYVTVTGNGFLYNMVRIIAGTLYYAGLKRLSLGQIRQAMERGDRTGLGKTMPAKGLTLLKVYYPRCYAERACDKSADNADGD